MRTEPTERRFPPAADDPRITPWVERVERAQGYQRPVQPTAAQRLRYRWWGTRRGLQLYWLNHILNRIPSHAVRLAFYRRHFEIGRCTSILLGLQLHSADRLIIGRNSTIGQKCVIDSRVGVRIGNNVSIGPYVQIWSGGHDINTPDFRSSGGIILIEDYVFIAAGAFIVSPMRGKTLTIGEGAVVGPGAMVMRDVEPYAVVFGNPARNLYRRTPDLDYTIDHFPPFQ